MEARNEIGGYRDANRATIRFGAWTLAWVVSLAIAKAGPGLLWGVDQTVASWAAVGLNVLVGIGWIVSFARYLRAIDELQRKIIQEALVFTLGVGWVGGSAYVVAENAGLVPSGINAGVFPIVLAAAFMVAIAIGHLRYR